jgi:cytochrome c553
MPEDAEAGAGAMLVACRQAGLSALVRNPKLGQFLVGRSPANVGQSPSWRAMWRQFGECVIMNIKHVAAIAVLFIGASPPVLADDQKPANAQERYVPPLNLIMVTTQLNHFKLWYAGAVRNWPLANYELAQIRTSIDRARQLYPNNVQSNMTMMMPPTEEVEAAIRAKDSVKFSEAFSKLTTACNTCHEATGFGFIRMRDPRLSPIETSPFSDESFSGH